MCVNTSTVRTLRSVVVAAADGEATRGNEDVKLWGDCYGDVGVVFMAVVALLVMMLVTMNVKVGDDSGGGGGGDC